jgi:hypothetical protein
MCDGMEWILLYIDDRISSNRFWFFVLKLREEERDGKICKERRGEER